MAQALAEKILNRSLHWSDKERQRAHRVIEYYRLDFGHILSALPAELPSEFQALCKVHIGLRAVAIEGANCIGRLAIDVPTQFRLHCLVGRTVSFLRHQRFIGFSRCSADDG